ncbi:sodium:proton antiporter [Aliidiomarina minuta]|uniref:Sodium:proton antiporter n=1 Tax=Aliidiomarina minuta TaxID=880057 RepID=A0A432W8D6_9GAMM|nr:hydrogenase subunit MbhD domain-containing protein [Aliidiomarina minuta]RUO26322.1 sodium:proton antiporter [Aliidiomarina minuta]
MMLWAFDIILGLGLLATAGGVFLSRDLFRAVIMFIAFGLLLALTWVRLDAPDLALAEAAIGAGLTGVLLLDTMGHLRDKEDNSPRHAIWWPLIASGGLCVLIVSALLFSPEPMISLADEVAQALPDSGVDHAITAVLLNFRSYDTLLEIAVLLVAVVVAMALRTEQIDPEALQESLKKQRDPLLRGLINRLLPLMLLVAIYVLWAGSYQPGGAFQAGAILAAAGVFMRLSGYDVISSSTRLLRVGLALGFLIFLLVASSVMIGGRPFLTYPEGLAGNLIFFIEAMLTLSIGLILFSLFVQAPEADDEH